jgi:pyruvate dehydrogenase E2 component (dihydrolipoamide acetyltransferase)
LQSDRVLTERRPLTRMRRAIVQSMTASAHIPQFTLESDANLTALAARRARAVAGGHQMSYSDVFVAACAKVLLVHPRLNASFDDNAIVEHIDINIALAVALDDGLVAPAIRKADTLTIPGIAAERERLTTAAREGTLSPEDLFSATFTISNLGPFGIRRFRALVVPPQAAILAVGAVTPEALISFSLSCDHRVVDGAPAATFLAHLIGVLEAPEWLNELEGPAGRLADEIS